MFKRFAAGLRTLSLSPDKSGKKSLAVLASIVLAFILWLVVSLQENYQVDITLPVQITGIPDEIDISPSAFSELTLHVGAGGLNVMGEWLRPQKDTIAIGYEQRFARGYLLPQNHLGDIRNMINPIQLLRIVEPDTFFFQVEKKTTKMVPLRSHVELNLKSGFLMESLPTLEPDSVRLAGPSHVLDTLTEWYTEAMRTPRLSERTSLRIPVLDTSLLVSVHPKSTQLTVHPEPYTQTQLNIRVEIFDIPPDTDVRLVDQSVSVACLVPVHEYESIVSQEFAFRQSFKTLTHEVPFIIPKFTFLPEYVKILSYQPDRIEYVIVKNQPIAGRNNRRDW